MRKFILAAAALATVSTAAYAAVTFDPVTGTGFVGKGDVQLAFNWNDARLQQNAAGVTFTYSAEEHYKFDCTFTVEVGRDKVREPRTQNRGRDTSISGSVVYDTRKNAQNKITGFNLTGNGATTSDGEAPVDGGSCPGGQFNDGTISDVQLISTVGGLFVNHGGSSSLLL